MKVSPKSQIFLVGCPRSGTTLLQSLLAAHPQIASFPESHFFKALLASRGPWRRRLRLASARARSRFNEFLHEIGHDELQKFLPRTALFTPQYVHAFVRVLDTLTEQQGKRFWLEKTPEHVRYIDYIERYLAAPKFIHILRNGADVVASLYEVTHQYPEAWNGPRDIDQCINQWVKQVQLSSCHLHKSNHILVRYDQLVEEPRQVLEELCEFIGVEFDEAVLQHRDVVAKQVILKQEPWKASVSEAIYNTKATKFYEQFSTIQRQYILEKVAVVDIETLSLIR